MNMETRIEGLKRLHGEAKEAQRVFMVKAGMLDDALKEFLTKDLKFDKEAKEIPLPELLSAVIKAVK